MGVELLDLRLQQLDAVQRALQSLVGAHDADVAPHRAAELVPVVREHDAFVGIAGRTIDPGGQGAGGGGSPDDLLMGGGGAVMGEDDGFQE